MSVAREMSFKSNFILWIFVELLWFGLQLAFVTVVFSQASVVGNADALRVLFNNLIDNALRHTPENGTVDVSIASDVGAVVVNVLDSGPGIPEADLMRVFDRFYRVPSTQAEFHGSGLGLAIVKQIADAHQATVSLSNTGHGLCASVRFAI